jgi:predicted TIM-barrel fold metal-dependent hydrolase
MIVDCHVHVCGDTPGHGFVSEMLRHSLTFRFMRWRLRLPSENGEVLEQALAAKLQETVKETEGLDAAVVLAFDAVYDLAGRFDTENTHFYVTNDYVAELARKHGNLLFGASVHPYRKDALTELERRIRLGAVLLKWLPIVQDFNPADERCLPLYEALAHHRLPLLCHTGGEQALPCLNFAFADPALLLPALQRGVTVIAAHCGTRSRPGEADFTNTFLRLAHEHEHFYGDTSALNLPTRSYAYAKILSDPVVRDKLVHGSDWPIISLPPLTRVGWIESFRLLRIRNWMRRDFLIKQHLGFDEAYWHRAAKLLRLPSRLLTEPPL